MLLFLQGMVVAGFTSVVISSIERRYELRSSESGLIASFYDIASVICLIPVSYFGGLGSKSRYIGVGMIILGFGSLLFSLPHYTSGVYTASGSDESLVCSVDNFNTECNQQGTLSYNKYIFYAAVFIQGVGGSPLFTLGPTWLDENSSVRSSSLYIGKKHFFMRNINILKAYQNILCVSVIGNTGNIRLIHTVC